MSITIVFKSDDFVTYSNLTSFCFSKEHNYISFIDGFGVQYTVYLKSIKKYVLVTSIGHLEV